MKMTNAEKFLKDGVNGIRPLLDKCREIGAIDSGREYRIDQMLREQVKPTLTEDEKVILRNIRLNGADIICRNIYGDLYLTRKNNSHEGFLNCYNHLFQFIKNGETYEIAELLK